MFRPPLYLAKCLFGNWFGLKGARFRALWSPILGRKRYSPELRARSRKFESDFRLFASNRTEKHHMTLLFFLRAVVGHFKDAAAGNARLEQDQSAMRVDRQSIGVLAKIFAL